MFLEKIVLYIKINRQLYIIKLGSLQNKLKTYKQFLLSNSKQLNTIKFNNLRNKLIYTNLKISKLNLDYIQIHYTNMSTIEFSINTIKRLLNIIKIKPFVFIIFNVLKMML